MAGAIGRGWDGADRPSEDDESLVARARVGNQAAFVLLVERYQRPVRRLALRLLRCPVEAEDATQETFLRAYTRLATYRPGSDFRAWLLAIAAHWCLDQLRRKRPVPLTAAQPLAAPGDGLEEGAIRAERRRAVRTAVAALSAGDRAMVQSRHWGGLSYAEIGVAAGVPLSTVRMRLFRAHNRLRAALAEAGDWGN